MKFARVFWKHKRIDYERIVAALVVAGQHIDSFVLILRLSQSLQRIYSHLVAAIVSCRACGATPNVCVWMLTELKETNIKPRHRADTENLQVAPNSLRVVGREHPFGDYQEICVARESSPSAKSAYRLFR